ncbi:hypothetical protein ACH5A3_02415 [Streptomyces echinatus]|uniref:hypothetical protein n=1 Tax=Streptomyces echinatus TaxID=67293 RepID=UPI0037996495
MPLVGHQVLLRYRKGTSGAFVTLKKVRTDRDGWATATVQATADGAHRYDFAGTSLTRATTGSATTGTAADGHRGLRPGQGRRPFGCGVTWPDG